MLATLTTFVRALAERLVVDERGGSPGIGEIAKGRGPDREVGSRRSTTGRSVLGENSNALKKG